MSMDLSGFVQAKTEIVIGTKKFIFSEVSLSDLAQLRAKMRKEKNAFNEQRRKRLIEDAGKLEGIIDPMELLKYVDAPVTDKELEAELDTVDGIGFLAYLSLKYAHPEVSIEDARKIVTPSGMVAITKAMFPKEKEKDKKKQPTRRRQLVK